jgi:chromosome partitioning protein
MDTPGGMHGFDLAKVVMAADALVMPVCNSFFDRESAASCLAELMTLPRVASKRCMIGVVGMRVDARTHASQTLREWALALHIPFLGVLRETQVYVRSLESGLTVFDLTGSSNRGDLEQWGPILQWLRPIAKLPDAAERTEASSPLINLTQAPRTNRLDVACASSLVSIPEAQVHGELLATLVKAHPDRQLMQQRMQFSGSANPFGFARDHGSATLT